jgi:hypothetical protein
MKMKKMNGIKYYIGEPVQFTPEQYRLLLDRIHSETTIIMPKLDARHRAELEKKGVKTVYHTKEK